MDNEWKYIEDQKDIDELMETYRYFHDSAIVSMIYEDRAHSDENGTYTYCPGNDRILNIVFSSEWKPNRIELKFAGVRQIRMTGHEEYEFIYGAYLRFHEDVAKYRGDKVLVWADDEDFKLDEVGNALDETWSYVIADRMKWRILGYGIDQT